MVKLKIKICGMRVPGNIRDIAGLMPDLMGFIYYPQSKRFAGELNPEDLQGLPVEIRKTAVFVNAGRAEALRTCRIMGYSTIQLHGAESPDECRLYRNSGMEVIKVFSIGAGKSSPETGVFGEMEPYLDVSDYFLFDTRGKGYGGTGKKFNWGILRDYPHEVPFFLSGGIAAGDLGQVLELDFPYLCGIDLNSGFETEPGLKDRDQLASFIDSIRENNEGEIRERVK